MAPTKATPSKTKAAAMEHLSHRVPDQFFADEYVSRKIENVWDTDLLRYAKDALVNVLLSGPTGPGKTSLILAYAATEKVPLITIQCNGAVDPNTFWGGWQPRVETADQIEKFLDLYTEVKKRSGKVLSDTEIMAAAVAMMDKSDLIWVDSEITTVIRYGGVLYLDEVNFLPPKVSAVFHGLTDKRRMITIPERGNEPVHASPELQVVAAYNPDYEGTKPLNAAFKNRFKIKVDFDYDRNVEKELVCVPIMLDLAQKLREAHKNGDLDTPVSTNMLIEFEELAVDLSYPFAVTNFLNAFHKEERKAVKEVFDLYEDQIKREVVEMERLSKEATS